MIQQTTVDGVPTLFAPTPGPVRAGLTFRVGRADETLSRAGLTHLIEHLALFHLNMADYHFNGATGPVTTDFHLQGSPSDIAAFLSGVCEALHNLPMHRLEVEKEILRTEHNSRSNSVLQPFSLWRYGSRGHGLLSYPELGLGMLGPDELRAWVATYFTKDNAVLWVAGPEIPPGLVLRLPAGHRQPLPAVTSALPTTPAFFYGEGTSVAYEGIMARRTGGNVFAGVLERELFRALRQENGLSYTAAASYEPRGDGYASIVALADALPEKQHAVLGGFIDVLAKLRVGRIDPADLAATVAKAEDSFERPDADAQRLPGAAFNLVTGYPNRNLDELRAELHAVTVDDLREIAQEVGATGLLMAPGNTNGAEWAGFVPAPNKSTSVVTGSGNPFRGQPDIALILGADGVSVEAPNGLATVRFAECAAMLVYPDGARHLVGHDGIGVRIEPTLVQLHPTSIGWLDTTVPVSLHAVQPARDPQYIPQPKAGSPGATAAGITPGKRSGWETALMIFLGLVALLFLCFGGLATIGLAADSDGNGAGAWVVVGFFWVFAIVMLVPVVLLYRRRQRQGAA